MVGLDLVKEFFSCIMARTSYISTFRWDNIRFVLDLHVELDLYSASSLKQQSGG